MAELSVVSQSVNVLENSMFIFRQINVRSLNSCFPKDIDLIMEYNFDVIAVTETWISDNSTAQLFNINGYKFISLQKPNNKRGGGVAFYVRDGITFTTLDTTFTNTVNNLEHLWIKFSCSEYNICFGVIYNPHEIYYKDLEVLDSILTELNSQFDYLICAGDINVDMLSNNYKSRFVADIITTNRMHQLIKQYTRPYSKTLLDVVLVSDINICVDSGVLDASNISDHDCVYCTLRFPKSIV